MLVRAFLPDTYLINWTEHSAQAIRNTFELTRGENGWFGSGSEPGHTLLHFEYVPNDYTGGAPYAAVYYWSP